MTLLMLWLGCSATSTQQAKVALTAAPIGEAECAVCGMIVSEQPSPRGQLIRRGGDHEFVCSLEELRALEQQPSSKGKPLALFVETLPDDFDLTSSSSEPMPWVRAEEAIYVFGAKRKGVMGNPVLSFSNKQTAERAAAALGSSPVHWTHLHNTPFHAIPAEAKTQK